MCLPTCLRDGVCGASTINQWIFQDNPAQPFLLCPLICHVWTTAVAQGKTSAMSNMVGCSHVFGLERCGTYDRGP